MIRVALAVGAFVSCLAAGNPCLSEIAGTEAITRVAGHDLPNAGSIGELRYEIRGPSEQRPQFFLSGSDAAIDDFLDYLRRVEGEGSLRELPRVADLYQGFGHHLPGDWELRVFPRNDAGAVPIISRRDQDIRPLLVDYVWTKRLAANPALTTPLIPIEEKLAAEGIDPVALRYELQTRGLVNVTSAEGYRWIEAFSAIQQYPVREVDPMQPLALDRNERVLYVMRIPRGTTIPWPADVMAGPLGWGPAPNARFVVFADVYEEIPRWLRSAATFPKPTFF